MKKPVKIYNISSRICSVNLGLNQDLCIHMPELKKIHISGNPSFLDLEKDELTFRIYQNSAFLNSWNNSKLFLGNLDIYYKSKNHQICVILDNPSNFLTIINPKNNIKINSNNNLEIILFSEDSEQFCLSGDSIKKLGYKVYKNESLLQVDSRKFHHHFWIKPQATTKINFIKKQTEHYVFVHLIKTSSKPQFYIRNAKLLRK